MGRMKKSTKACLEQFIECGMISMRELMSFKDEEIDFTIEDVEEVYLLLLKKFNLLEEEE